MLQTFKNAWKLDDIRGKLLFTLLIIVLYRIGAVIPVPYVNSALLQQMFSLGNGSIFQYMNILSGDAFSKDPPKLQ